MIETAGKLSEFLEWVAKVRKAFKFDDTDKWNPWFRGQRQADWKLLPTLYRPSYDSDIKEDEIREEFIVRAPALSAQSVLPSSDWGWYFLMQHFKAPTRLLDWTESALLALHFAVSESDGEHDAIVWALDPYEQNKAVFGKDNEEVVCPDATGVPKMDLARISPWLPGRRTKKRLRQKPIAIYPMHADQRIGTQRSGFTIHGSNRRPLDEIFRLNKPPILTRFDIPRASVQATRRELERVGIDETTAFPDLDGLGRSLCQKWEGRKEEGMRPHTGVYTRLGPSKIHGVGVFAIRRIKKGTHLFADDLDEMVWVDESQVPKRPRALRDLYDDFCPIDKARRYGCPPSFNRLTMSWYINESRKGNPPANVRLDPTTYEVYATRDIQVGKELLAKYDTYSEPTERELNR